RRALHADAARRRRARPRGGRVRARRLPGAQHGERDGGVPRRPRGRRGRTHVPRADPRPRHRRRGPRSRLRRTPGGPGFSARVRRSVHARRARGRRRGGGRTRGRPRAGLYSRAMSRLSLLSPLGTTAGEVKPLARPRGNVRGVPVAVLGTDAFVSLAEAAAAALGMPHLQLVAVTHPLGGIDPKLARAKADGVVDRVIAALTRDPEPPVAASAPVAATVTAP